MTEPSPPTLTLTAAIDALASPYAMEDFSALTGASSLVVDLRDTSPAADSETALRAQMTLAQLACPTIAITQPSQANGNHPWSALFDVCLEDETDLVTLDHNIRANPQASLAMVQLLRHSRGLSIHDGLTAESLVYSTLQSGPEFATWLRDRKRPSISTAANEPAVNVIRDAETVHVTLNRPERHNAFSAEMRDAFAEVLQVIDADASIRSVVLRGAGASFCSGGDLAEFGTLPDPATAHVIRSTRNPARLLARCADRVRCEVHGACVGAGAELPAFTSNVRAHRDATFWLPEVSMGLVPGAGGTVSLPRRIGAQRTNYLALSGRRINSEQALQWGLVDELSN